MRQAFTYLALLAFFQLILVASSAPARASGVINTQSSQSTSVDEEKHDPSDEEEDNELSVQYLLPTSARFIEPARAYARPTVLLAPEGVLLSPDRPKPRS